MPAESEPEAGQDARVVTEEAVAVAADVAEDIGDEEGVAVLQHEQAKRYPWLARIGGLRRTGR